MVILNKQMEELEQNLSEVVNCKAGGGSLGQFLLHLVFDVNFYGLLAIAYYFLKDVPFNSIISSFK